MLLTRFRNCCAVIAILTLAMPLSSQDESGDATPTLEKRLLTLEEAVHLALEHNITLQVERVSEARSQRERIIAAAAFDPLFRTGYDLSKSRRVASDITQGGLAGSVSERDNRNYNIGLEGLLATGTTWTFSIDGNRSEFSSNDPTSSTFFSPLSYNSGYTLRLTQPLLRGRGRGPTEFGLRVAGRTAEISQLTLQREVEQTIASVIGTYWDLVSARRDLDVKQRALGEANELLEINRRKLEVGSGTEIDVISAEANIETQKAGIIDSLNARHGAQDSLLDLINAPEFRRGGAAGPIFRELEVVPTTPLELPEFPVSLPDSVRNALDNRLEIAQQRLRVSNVRDQLDQAQNDVLPSLQLTGSWNQPGTADTLNQSWSNIGDDYVYSAGISLEIPFGNRAASQRHLQAQDDLRSVRLEREQVANGIVLEVTQAVRELSSARQSVETNRAATRLRREQLDGERRRLEVGVSTSYQVLQIQNDLLEAEVALLQAQVRLRKAMTSYHNATGEILRVRGIKLE